MVAKKRKASKMSSKRSSRASSKRKNVGSKSVARKAPVRRNRGDAGLKFKFGEYALAHSLGIVSAIALLLYAAMSWFGSYDSSIVINQYPVPFSFSDWTIIIGLIQGYVLAYIGGWIFAKLYNKISS